MFTFVYNVQLLFGKIFEKNIWQVYHEWQGEKQHFVLARGIWMKDTSFNVTCANVTETLWENGYPNKPQEGKQI